MKRRDFLATSCTSLIAAITAFHSPMVLAKLLPAPRRSDPESQMCYWMMDNLSANEVIYCIKHWGFTQEGKLSDFFNSFVERQPEIVVWLKARVLAKVPNKDSEMFERMKKSPRSPGEKWYRDASDKYKCAMNKFGFPISKWHDVNLENHMACIYWDSWHLNPDLISTYEGKYGT